MTEIPKHLPADVVCRIYWSPDGEATQVIDARKGDPFEIMNRAARKLGLPVDDSAWNKMLERKARAAREQEEADEVFSPPPAVMTAIAFADESPEPPVSGNGAGVAEADGAGPGIDPISATSVQAPVASPARSGVRDTSMHAYRALAFSGELAAQQQKIVDLFLVDPTATKTRQEIARATGLSINATCGRVAELMMAPFEVLVECEERRECSITKNRVTALRLARTGEERTK